MQRHPFPVRPLSAAPPLIKHAGHPNSRKEQKKSFVSSDHSKRKTVPKSKITPNSVDNRNRKHKQKQMHSREDAGNKGLKSADYKSTLEPDIDAEMTEKLSKKIVMENNHNVLPASPIVESKSGSEIVKSDNTDEQEKIESASEEDQGLSEQDPLRINECSRASRELMQSELCHALKVKEDQSRPSIPMQKVMTLTAQREPMLTTNSVPMNFGIELLDSVIHNNIELIADQEVVIRANSVILSLNSPVIHRITTCLELKEIDMKEFSEKSVRVFVEAAYTGRLPDIPSDVFRDLHKISHAFKVEWLSKSCFAMFSEFSLQLDEPASNYLVQVFLFEEAAYVLSKLKLAHFRDLVISKIQTNDSGKKMFITKYLKDLSSLSACHLDMIALLAGSDIDLIVDPLKELLLRQIGVKGAAISDECKYLLNKCDLSPCRRYSRKLFEQFFDVLQELAGNSTEDMKWVFQLHRNSANKSEEILKEEKIVKDENYVREQNKAEEIGKAKDEVIEMEEKNEKDEKNAKEVENVKGEKSTEVQVEKNASLENKFLTDRKSKWFWQK